MKKYKGYLIDLDGTMYRGTESIESAVAFVKRLEEEGIPYLFVTNNSSKTPEQVAEHLREFGVPATEEHVFTTSMATASFLREQKENASVYIVGGEGIRSAITQQGMTITDDHPDYVIVGLDREVTYEKLAKACLAVRAGATFISTNGDVALPTERGFMPGNGAITSVVSVSTGVTPIFIGKPESIIVNQALEKIGTPKSETVMVGDNYHTDILAGIRGGIDTLLVYTGVTTKEHIEEVDVKPTHAVDSLADWDI
ncbi:TIGR01457 family HAD-type hydrolase [Bacillus taeanensis]|uniref:TIGR01457 family HAD-type hydrolase n=1 Tax=Bacillus taeanensis TaxID=273032 RepID=A0A366Y2Q7_9BACI|nr:TIGR01457 family HAD-type hydrolase [Bacillus taeanensis]RBW71289.1 TIGR01457 family HAD-type hydrolase [Bacillus taeanensis]